MQCMSCVQDAKSQKADFLKSLNSGMRCAPKLFFKHFLGQFCAGRRGKLLICKLLFLFLFAAALFSLFSKHLDLFYAAAGCRLCSAVASNHSFC